jgi:hypothetical protein
MFVVWKTVRRSCVAVSVCLALLGSITPALGNGTNTTLPSECASNSHPAGCWGNVRMQDVFKGVDAPAGAPPCPNISVIDKLFHEITQVDQQITNGHYKHRFLVPQGLAAYDSTLLYARYQEELACAADIPQRRALMLTDGIFDLDNAAYYARIAGSAEKFNQFNNEYFAFIGRVLADPGAGSWLQEEAFWSKRDVCTSLNPDIGSEYPDYGRLFTWDDFHRFGCDNFNYY